MNTTLTVKTVNATYPIYIESDSFVTQLSDLILKNKGCKIALITDQNLHRLYAKSITPLLKRFKQTLCLITIKSGESQKNQASKTKIETRLFEHGFNRDDILIAWGGGVIGDLVGYVAATFMRGVPYYAFPTSIIAMVDSSIGGKTGIDTPFGKNLIGAFYHPSAVYIDINFINTLNETEFINGMAEVAKYHFIKNTSIGKSLLVNFKAYQKRSPEFMHVLIKKSLVVKQAVVEQDEKEGGIRRILNFGHTVGHAIEHLSNYRIKHGYAIAKGMSIEGYWSYLAGHLSLKDYQELITLLYQLGFSLNLPTSLNNARGIKKIYQTCKLDKKAVGQEVYYVALQKIGAVVESGGAYRERITAAKFSSSLEEYQNFLKLNNFK